MIESRSTAPAGRLVDVNDEREIATLASLVERWLFCGPTPECALLRDAPAPAELVDQGDLDLLCSARSALVLIERLAALPPGETPTFRVERVDETKTLLTLYSASLRHTVRLDLWHEIWQVFGGRRSIRYSDLEPHVVRSSTGLSRLSPEVDLAIYLQHLEAKHKDLSDETVRARLRAAATRARFAGDAGLADAAEALAESGVWNSQASRLAQRVLARRLGRSHALRCRGRALRRRALGILRRWTAPRAARTARIVAFVGADGAGKTTLAEALAGSLGVRLLTAKRLYRESLVFRLIYRVQRTTVGGSLERADEAWAGLAAAVGAFRLRRQAATWAREGTILDRNLPDFVYIRRKSDRPHFSRWAFLTRVLGVPVPVIHLVVPGASRAVPKAEMTSGSILRYDREMRDYYLGSTPTDYLRFPNAGPASVAALALGTHLECRLGRASGVTMTDSPAGR